MGYRIEDLDNEEWDTLCWLNARGYDAGIAQFFTESDAGTATCRVIAEHEAWQVNEAVDEDKEAFLACNGSETLREKLWDFINSIV
jgi:hypothetical protein